MQRGNLIIYDNSGKVWHQTRHAEGNVLPHEYPDGLPYLEIPFDDGRFVESVDVSKSLHEPIFEVIITEPTSEEIITDLENQLLLMADQLEGGIL